MLVLLLDPSAEAMRSRSEYEYEHEHEHEGAGAMLIAGRTIVEHAGTTPPIVISHVRWSERRGLLLKLQDEDGLRGVGEASPLPGYSTESLDDCRRELSQLSLGEIGDPLRVPVHHPAARFAVETALLDLAAQHRSCSIADILGRARDRVPLSAIAYEDDDVQRAIDRGITTVKLKVGGRPIEQDVARIASLRHRYGDQIALRLDANQAWSPEEAERAMIALAPLRPELIEEPSRDWERLDPQLPLAVDESLQSMSDDRIAELARRKVIAALVLKPMALGGFSRCLHLAKIAEEHGLACIVTHLFDGPVALAAAAELALALPGRILPCGLDRHRGLSAWPLHPLPQIGDNEISAIG